MTVAIIRGYFRMILRLIALATLFQRGLSAGGPRGYGDRSETSAQSASGVRFKFPRH